MPFYGFECERCESEHVVRGSMASPPKDQRKCECGGTMYRQFNFRIDGFRPYVDEHTTGDKVELTTKGQRDAFLKNNGVTLDSSRYSIVHKRKYENPLDKVGSVDTWARAMKDKGIKL